MIKILFNGNPNVALNEAHKYVTGLVQLERTFKTWDDAVQFNIECSFYGGCITSLDEIMDHVPQEIKDETEVIYNLETNIF
jgi:hypothetical protein